MSQPSRRPARRPPAASETIGDTVETSVSTVGSGVRTAAWRLRRAPTHLDSAAVGETAAGVRVRRVVAALFATYAAILAILRVRHGDAPGVEHLLLFLVAAAIAGNRLGRFIRDWGIVLAGVFAYAMTGRLVAGLDFGVHFTPQIEAEKLLALGAVPTLWLQSVLYDGSTGVLETFAVVMYLSHFVAPLVLGFYLWWRRSRGFTELMFALLALSILAEITFVLAPTAPPWLAAQQGYLPQVDHVLRQGFFDLGLDRLGNLVGDRSHYNVVAAFPSLHAGFPIVCLLVGVAYKLPRWVLGLQTFQMLGVFFAIVYTGDHYVVDIAAAAAYAAVAWAVVHRAFRGEIRARRASTQPATAVPEAAG